MVRWGGNPDATGTRPFEGKRVGMPGMGCSYWAKIEDLALELGVEKKVLLAELGQVVLQVQSAYRLAVGIFYYGEGKPVDVMLGAFTKDYTPQGQEESEELALPVLWSQELDGFMRISREEYDRILGLDLRQANWVPARHRDKPGQAVAILYKKKPKGQESRGEEKPKKKQKASKAD